MKKTTKFLIAGLVSATLLAGAGYALTAEDSLVTLKYVTNQFMPAAETKGSEVGDKMLQDAYNAGKSKLDQAQNELMGQVDQGNPDEQGPSSAVLTPMDCYDEQIYTGKTGTSFLMREGTAVVRHDGAFIDVSTGTEVGSDAVLQNGHRYLVGENTSAQVEILSGAARLGVQGQYQHSGGNQNHTPFYDVSRLDPYYDSVTYVYQKGYFAGIGPTEFGPDCEMDRAMVMTVFYKMAGLPEDEMAAAAHHSFTDVPESKWYAPYIKWAFDQHITSGTGPHTFHPEELITREQFIQLLYNFSVKYLGKDLPERTDLSGWADLDELSDWAKDAVSWGVATGVLTSRDGKNLDPQGSNTRAEIAQMLHTYAVNVL